MIPPTPPTNAPFVKNSVTSKASAKQIDPKTGVLRLQVLGFISSCLLGATDEEIQIGLKMNPSTQRPRRVELVARGHVEDSGKKRKTSSGRKAVVWIRKPSV